jgi:N-formylglutamate amidohydrolase
LSGDIRTIRAFDALMDGPIILPSTVAVDSSPFRLLIAERPSSPVVFTSSHSGRSYDAEFLSGVRLCSLGLRRSEDSFVDELFSAAPSHGAALLAANFPRAFCDANREPWELDPSMFADPLPTWVNTTSARVTAGLGTIARVVASGEPIYSTKLPFAEAERRIETYWRPFHNALARLVSDTKARFGFCWVIDCHSMPTSSQMRRSGGRPVDFVLGDLHGVACASRATRFVESFLSARGYVVRRNDPYAGGFITAHYGRPADDVHVLQIEIARGLYMDEARIERLTGFPIIQRQITDLISALTHDVHDLIG